MMQQVDALGALVRATSSWGLSVKDSFGCLDIGTLGFVPLFDAEWIFASRLRRLPPGDLDNVHWLSIACDTDLARWEQAWRPGTDVNAPRIFRPKLLERPEIQFVYGLVDDRPVGGGVLNATEDVTGLSNLFASGISIEVALQGLASVAWTWRPGRPLVGYESGADLAAALKVGFEAIGQLRLWHRASSAV